MQPLHRLANCQLMSSCPLRSRHSSLYLQAARRLRHQLRYVCRFYLHVFISFKDLDFVSCNKHFMRTSHAWHYSTPKIGALSEKKKTVGQLNTWYTLAQVKCGPVDLQTGICVICGLKCGPGPQFTRWLVLIIDATKPVADVCIWHRRRNDQWPQAFASASI